MKYTISIHKMESLQQLPKYWNNQDYRQLLEEFGVEGAADIEEAELWEYICMAVSDLEPREAAEIVLKYKLGEVLNEGQIENIAHEMLEDKISEEYPEIALHYPLFNINQLLYKAYNGKFPKIMATQMDLEFIPKSEEPVTVTKTLLLKSLAPLLSDGSLVKRLFEEQLEEDASFAEANNIVWELEELGEQHYRLVTSDYWINREDILDNEYSN